MRVLITGGAGFLGSHLSDAFIARGDEVFVLDTGSIAKVRHLLNNPGFHYVHDSVFNVELIDSLVSRVDLIYHLAAVVGVAVIVSLIRAPTASWALWSTRRVRRPPRRCSHSGGPGRMGTWRSPRRGGWLPNPLR